MVLSRNETEVSPNVAERRVKELLAKAQQRAAEARQLRQQQQHVSGLTPPSRDGKAGLSEKRSDSAATKRSGQARPTKSSSSSTDESDSDDDTNNDGKGGGIGRADLSGLAKLRAKATVAILPHAKGIKSSPSSDDSDSSTSEERDIKNVKPLPIGRPPPTKPIKRAPSSSSSSEDSSLSESELKPTHGVKMAGAKSTRATAAISSPAGDKSLSGPAKLTDPTTATSSSTPTSGQASKRKRNSILPKVVDNPWKRQRSLAECRDSTPEHCEPPPKAAKKEVHFVVDEDSTSSSATSDEETSPLRPGEEDAATNAETMDTDVANETSTTAGEAEDAEYFRPLGSSKAGKKKASLRAAIPKWVQRAVPVSSKVEFDDDLDQEEALLGKHLVAALRESGIQGLFPIQKEVIRCLLDERVQQQSCPPRDICVAAPTGSGKTLAFVLPLIRLLEGRFERAIRAVILLPTTELAKQVFDVLTRFLKTSTVTAALLAGLKSRFDEEKVLLERGHSLVDVVVATPAKLLEHLRTTQAFSLRFVELLVLDEADRMVDMIQHGLIQEIEEAVFSRATKKSGGESTTTIENACRCDAVTVGRARPTVLSCCSLDAHHIPLRKLLYSATLMSDPEKLKYLNLFYPKVFHAGRLPPPVPSGKRPSGGDVADMEESETTTPSGSAALLPEPAYNGNGQNVQPTMSLAMTLPERLEERWMACDLSLRPLLVWWLATRKKHIRMLVFTRTREECHRLRVVLEHLGDCRVVDLSADMKKRQRQRALHDFENGACDVLVSTGVLSRGMDLSNVEHVLLYHAPRSAEEYVHAVGRTARANRHGVSIVLINEQEEKRFKKTLKAIVNSRVKQAVWDCDELKPYYERYEQSLSLAKKELQQHRSTSQPV